jgi:hypothetical protein
MGLSTLYLTSYLPGLTCVSLENIPEYSAVSQWVYRRGARTPIDLRLGDYRQLLPGILREMQTVDFVFFNLRHEQNPDAGWFYECMKHIHNETVFVFDRIRSSRHMLRLWKEVCSHPGVTVTIDLYSMGIVFFNQKLHKRQYIVYF